MKIICNEHGVSTKVKDDAIDLLKKHHWPGNVRELKNVERLILSEEIITKEDIKNQLIILTHLLREILKLFFNSLNILPFQPLHQLMSFGNFET